MSRPPMKHEKYSKDPHLAGLLFDALRRRNLSDFRYALEVVNCDPNLVDASSGLSPFQHVLQTPKSVEFIKLCVNHGGNFYEKSGSGRFPIHFVVKSMCLENLDVFLSHYDRARINLKCSDQNCLHLLVNGLTELNYQNVEQCIKLLLSYGCSPNMPDNASRTPFYLILYKEATLSTSGEIIDAFLKNSDIDFHTYKSQEVINMMRTFRPEHHIPPPLKVVNFDFMMTLLNIREELEFEIYFKAFQNISREKSVDDCLQFFEVAVACGLTNTVEVLIAKNVNVNARAKQAKYLKPPAFQACASGSHQILAMLLKRPELDFSYQRGAEKYTLLHEICQNFTGPSTNSVKVDYQKCLDMVVKDRRCDVNTVDDLNCSALHYTVKYKNEPATLALLRKGAYINGESNFGKTPIDEMSYATLENFLNECIVSDETCGNTKSDFVIDYNFLVAPKRFQTLEGFSREISALKRISDNQELSNLINHPVLASFLFLKWTTLKFLFHLNTALSLVFLVALTTLFMASQYYTKDNRSDNRMIVVCQTVFIFTIVFLLVREILQICLSFKKVFERIMSWLVILITVSACLMFFSENIDHNIYQIILGALLLVGALLELIKVVTSLPSLSLMSDMQHCGRVFLRLLRDFALFAVVLMIIVAVSVGTINDDESHSKWIQNVVDCLKEPHTNNSSSSCVHLYVMSILFLSTVLWFSLIKAFSSSTQSTKERDRTFILAKQINIINSCEATIFESNSAMTRVIFNWLRVGISLFPRSISSGKIIVRPSQGDAILTFRSKNAHNTMLEVVNMRPLISRHENLNDYRRFAIMPLRIMTQIENLLSTRNDQRLIEARAGKLRNEIIAIISQMNYQIKINNQLLTEQRIQTQTTSLWTPLTTEAPKRISKS